MKFLKIMPRYLPVCLLFLMACIAAIGGSGVPAQARSLAEIQQTKEIRICAAPIHPTVITVEPADCRENCKFGGGGYEIAIAFASTLGNDVKPKVLRVEFDEQFFNKEGKVVREVNYTPQLLASGTCDLYATNFTKLPWRLKKIDFVILYPTRNVVIVHKSKKEEFKTAVHLSGKVTATVKDSVYHTWLQEQNESVYAANPVKIELVPTEEEGIKAVEEGKVDFTILLMDAAMWSLRHRFKDSVATFVVGPMYEQGWGFRKEDKDLQAAVQKFFDTQRANENSVLNKIWEKDSGMSLIDFIGLVTKIE